MTPLLFILNNNPIVAGFCIELDKKLFRQCFV